MHMTIVHTYMYIHNVMYVHVCMHPLYIHMYIHNVMYVHVCMYVHVLTILAFPYSSSSTDTVCDFQ